MAQVRLGRIFVVGMGVALLVLLGLPKEIFGSRTTAPMWMVLVLGFAVIDAIGMVLIAERMVKPLARGLDETSARLRGVVTLRGLIFLRAAVAATPALIGLGLAAIVQTVATPFMVMLPVSLALLAVAYPRMALVMSVRDRLERAGAASHLVVSDAVTRD